MPSPPSSPQNRIRSIQSTIRSLHDNSDSGCSRYSSMPTSPATAIQSFIPQTLRHRLLTHKTPKHWIHLNPAALVAIIDLTGFSVLANTLANDTDLLVETLNCSFQFMVEAVEEHGGDVVSFAGDALIVVWHMREEGEEGGGGDAPVDNSRNAIAALCAIVRHATDPKSRELMSVHIGIGYGFATEINVGSDVTYQYFVTGAAVQDASSALDAAGDSELRIGPLFHDFLKKNHKDIVNLFEFDAPPPGQPQRSNLSDNQRAVLRDMEAFSYQHSSATAQPIPTPNIPYDSLPLSAQQVLAIASPNYVPRPALASIQEAANAGIPLSLRAMDNIRVVTTVFLQISPLKVSSTTSFRDAAPPTAQDREAALGESTQTLFTHILDLLTTYSGMVRQFVVDDKGYVLIACFGVPGYTHDDDPARAIEFAHAVEQNITYVDVSIGVTTSKLFCGSVGSMQRREYAVVGDGCNLAARLMTRTQVRSPPTILSRLDSSSPCTIACDEATYTATCSEFNFELEKNVTIKGRPKPMDVYHLKSRDTSAKSRNAEFLNAFSSFVGRPVEKAFVMDAIFNGKIVYVTGPEGFGKSNLMMYAASVSRKMGLTTLVASASDQLKLQPHGILGVVVKQLLRLNSESFQGLSSTGKVMYVKRMIANAVENFHKRIEKDLGRLDRRPSAMLGGASANLPDNASVQFTLKEEGSEFDNDDDDEAGEERQKDEPSSRMRQRKQSMPNVEELGSFSEKIQGVSSGVSETSGARKFSFDNSFSPSRQRSKTHSSDISLASDSGVPPPAHRRSIFKNTNKVAPLPIPADPTAPDPNRFSRDEDNIGTQTTSGLGMLTMKMSKGSPRQDEIAAKASLASMAHLEIDDFLFLLQSSIDLGVTASRTASIEEMPTMLRSQALSIFFYWLLSTQRKSVIIIDEINSIDAHSWRVLTRIASKATNVCIVLSGAPKDPLAITSMTKLAKFKRYDRIVMKPLDRAAIETLATSLSEGLPWPDQIITYLLEATGGHPSQCVGLIKTLWATDMVCIASRPPGSNAPPALAFSDDETIRNTIVHFELNSETVILRRFDAITEMSKELLKCCSVMGHHFTPELAHELLPRSMKSQKDSLKLEFESLIQNGWIHADDVNERVCRTFSQGGRKSNGSSKNPSPHPSRPSSADGSRSGAFSEEDFMWAPLKKKHKGTFSFVAIKVLKAIYEMIPASTTRKQMHLKAARAIKKTYIDDLNAFFPLLVHHFHLGGDQENEIKNAQMTSEMTYRMGHLEDTLVFTQICVDLSPTVKFREFENFDKNATLSEWYLRLAECQYVLGELQQAREQLDRAVFYANEQKSGFEKCDTKALNAEIIEVAKWVFSKKYKGSALRKNDETGSTIVKSLVMICLLSTVNLDEQTLLSATVMLLREFRRSKTIHSAAEACMLSYSMRNFVDGKITGWACSYLEKKGKLFMKGQGKMFKLSSALCIDIFQAHYTSGQSLINAKRILDENMGSMSALQTNVGQIEVQYALWHCNNSLGLTGEALENSTMLQLLSQHAKSPAFKVWSASTIARRGTSLVQVKGAGSGRGEFAGVMARLRSVKQSCSLDYSVISRSVLDTSLIGKKGGEGAISHKARERHVRRTGSKSPGELNRSSVKFKDLPVKSNTDRAEESLHRGMSGGSFSDMSGEEAGKAEEGEQGGGGDGCIYLPALSCLDLHANEAYLTILCQEAQWESVALAAAKAAAGIMADINVALVTPFAAESYIMTAEALLFLRESMGGKWDAGDDALVESARDSCESIGAKFVSCRRKAAGVGVLYKMGKGQMTKTAAGSKLKSLKKEAEKSGCLREAAWLGDYVDERCNNNNLGL